MNSVFASSSSGGRLYVTAKSSSMSDDDGLCYNEMIRELVRYFASMLYTSSCIA